MEMQIVTYLSVQDALASGAARHGRILVEPTEQQLASLDTSRRVQLAPYVARATSRGGIDSDLSLTVSAPGWSGVVAGLDAAIAKREREAADRAAKIEHERESYRKILAGGVYEPGVLPLKKREYGTLWTPAPNYSRDDEEAKRLWTDVEALRLAQAAQIIREADERLSYDVVGDKLAEPIRVVLQAAGDMRRELGELAPRAASFSSRLVAELAARDRATEAANRAALRGIIETDGDANQLERYDAGVLPERELTDLVQRKLFAPLDGFAPYPEITESDVVEHCDCEPDSVKFASSTVEPGELDADEWSTLQGIRKASPEGSVVEMREHIGYARGRAGEDDPEIRRYGIRVTVEFAGRKWSREFAM